MAKVFFDPDKDELIVRTRTTIQQLSASERKLLQHIAEGNQTVEHLKHFLTTAGGQISIEEAESLLDAALANLVFEKYLYTIGRPPVYHLTQSGWNILQSREDSLRNPIQASGSKPSVPKKSQIDDYPTGYYANYMEEDTRRKKPALNAKDGMLADSFDDFYGIIGREEVVKEKKKSKSYEEGFDDLFF